MVLKGRLIQAPWMGLWAEPLRGELMGIVTIEGVVDRGRIRLKSKIRLPDKTRVYVVVPDIQVEQIVHVLSPRLAHREQAADFALQVLEEPTVADV